MTFDTFFFTLFLALFTLSVSLESEGCMSFTFGLPTMRTGVLRRLHFIPARLTVHTDISIVMQKLDNEYVG
jgi:hypothetical protein